MGHYEQRKARDQGEEAFTRGSFGTANPYDRFGSHNEDLCRREWDDGYRYQERLGEERQMEEEAKRREKERLAEQRRQADQEEEWQWAEQLEYERQRDEREQDDE